MEHSASRGREADEKRAQERRRALMVLVLRHLADCGYSDAYAALSAETGLSLTKLDAADNIDLPRVLAEFEEGHESRFGRRPKLVRRVAAGEDAPQARVRRKQWHMARLIYVVCEEDAVHSSASETLVLCTTPRGALAASQLCGHYHPTGSL
jgi:hypothetical protein